MKLPLWGVPGDGVHGFGFGVSDGMAHLYQHVGRDYMAEDPRGAIVNLIQVTGDGLGGGTMGDGCGTAIQYEYQRID